MDPDAMAALAKRIENKIRGGWKDMVREIKDSNTLPQLEARIAGGSRAILVGVDAAAEHLAREVTAGYFQAAQRAGRAINATVGAFRFDVADQQVIEWIRRTSQEIISSLVAEQEAVANRVIQLGRARGLNARAISEEVQGSIGLNVSQVDVVANYRRTLEMGNYARAQTYELADRRFAATLERARAAGSPLSTAQVDRMVERYRDGWGRYRAENVSGDLGTQAAHAGVDEAFGQAVEDQVMEMPKKRWYTRGDSRVRVSHRVMHGQVRRMNQTFLSGEGNALRYPGDENAPSSDTAGCRCVSVIELPSGQMAVETGDGGYTLLKFAEWIQRRHEFHPNP